MRTQAYPPPYLGIKDDIPLAVIENPYAESVRNFNLDDGVPSLRKGDSVWYNDSASARYFLNFSTYGVAGNQKLFGVYPDAGPTMRWVDLTTSGTATSVHTFGIGNDDEIHTLFFNNYLFFFGEASLATTPQYYNGAAWGTAGYVWPGSFSPFGGGVYKNRAYFIGRNSAKYAYSEINAISGVTTEVDLSQIISTPAYLYGIRSISLSEGIQQQNVLAFIMSSGEVLVYAGSYPNSSDWSLVGVFFIPEPVYYNAFVDARGDSFVITKASLISLRELFIQGSTSAADSALSANIKNLWASSFQNLPAGFEIFIKGIYDSINDRIIIATYSAGVARYRLIYSFKTKSWVEAVALNTAGISTTTAIAYFQNNTFYAVDNYLACFKVEGAAGYVDEGADPGGTDTTYPFLLLTAPLYTEGFGSNVGMGIELICLTDSGSAIGYYFKGNLGQVDTSSSLQNLPSLGSGIANPLVNIGIDSNYLQFGITGYTDSSMTLGTKIYAMNLWSEKGGVR